MPFELPCMKHHLRVQAKTLNSDISKNKGLDILIGYGREYGVALEDVDGAQFLLLCMLDGKHTFSSIVARLQMDYPDVTEEDVTEILDDLTRLELLEDNAIPHPSSLTEMDLDRYASQIRCFSILDTSGTQKYAAQARIKQARVTILGLGGLGSNVLIGLAAMGVGFIRVVDFDQVELGNLNRQVLYNPNHIGQLKVMVATEQIQNFNPELHIEPINKCIENSEHIVELIQDTDLVVMCADRPTQITHWMNSAALYTGVPFIQGGYHGALAEAGPFVIPFQTGCIQCASVEQSDAPLSLPDELAWLEYNTWALHPNAYFVTAIAANLICSEICKYITKLAPPSTYNQIFGIDTRNFTTRMIPRPRHERCPACSHSSRPHSQPQFSV